MNKVDAYMRWARSLQLMDPRDRMHAILAYYTPRGGATIKVIKTLMSQSRRPCERILHEMERCGQAGLVYWERSPRKVSAHRQKGRESIHAGATKRMWVLKGAV